MNSNTTPAAKLEDTQNMILKANAMRADYIQSLAVRASQAAGRVWRAMMSRARSRQLLTELNSLSERELSDIGLTRGDIPYLAKQLGSGRPVAENTNLPNDVKRRFSQAPANTDGPTAAPAAATDTAGIRQRAA